MRMMEVSGSIRAVEARALVWTRAEVTVDDNFRNDIAANHGRVSSQRSWILPAHWGRKRDVGHGLVATALLVPRKTDGNEMGSCTRTTSLPPPPAKTASTYTTLTTLLLLFAPKTCSKAQQ